MKRWDLAQYNQPRSKPAQDWPEPAVVAAQAPIAAELHVGRQPQALAVPPIGPQEKVASPGKHKRHALLLIALLAFAAWLSYMTFRKAAIATAITNFRECVDFGYPTTETEPMLCTTASGRVFTDALASLQVSNKHNLSFNTLVDAKTGPVAGDTAVLTDQKSWQAFWVKTHAQLKQMPPILAVDFKNTAVAGAAYGQQATDGYRIAITNIYETEREVDIEVTKWKPGVGCDLPGRALSPYHLVTFPKPTKPTVFVIVNKQQAACETKESVDSSVSGY